MAYNGLGVMCQQVHDFMRRRRSNCVFDSIDGRVVSLNMGSGCTGTGVLIYLDPHTGREIWRRKQHATVIDSVIASVFGDPCPFLILWSIKYRNGRTRIRSRGGRLKTTLEITVLDSHTGELVGHTEQHPAVRPLQILHDRTNQQLSFTTEHSTIEMDCTN